MSTSSQRGEPDTSGEVWRSRFATWLREHDVRRADLSALISFYREAGGSWRDVAAGMELLGGTDSAQLGPPIWLAEFVAGLATASGHQTLLDPFGTPVFDVALFSTMDAQSGLAVSPAPDVPELGRALDAQLNWLGGWPEQLLQEVSDRFDLIFCAPPFGMRRSVEDRPTLEIADYASSLLATLPRYLSEGGTMAFVLADGFLFGRDGRQAREALAAEGIRFRAALAIEGGIAGTAVAANLCIFDRGDPAIGLFVGQLTDRGSNEALLNNLIHETASSTPVLGAYRDPDAYRGWRALSAEFELHQSIRQSRTRVARLSELALSITKLRPTNTTTPPNVVYLPDFPTAAATTVAPDGQPSHFIEVVLDPELASADYVAQWLNEPLGRLARRALATGTTMQRIRASEVGDMLVVAPSIEHQLKASAVSRQVSLVLSELEQVRARIWAGQTSTDEALSMVQGLEAAQSTGQPDEPATLSTDQWIDGLPFPLASIAHRYDAVAGEAEKVQHLLHFFEAYAIFLTTVLLSAGRHDAELNAQVVEKLRRLAEKGPSLERADYGLWITVGRTVRKSIASALGNDKSGELSSALFDHLGQRCVEVMTDTSIWEILDQPRKIRNQRAHGGIESPATLRIKLQELEGILLQLRGATTGLFDRVNLIRPGTSMQEDDGTFIFPAAQVLTGSNPMFREQPVRSAASMKGKRLYLVNLDATLLRPLELIPFITLGAPLHAEDNAVFFYSRRNEKGTGYRYVSYHFEAMSEDIIKSDEMDQFLTDLSALPSETTSD